MRILPWPFGKAEAENYEDRLDRESLEQNIAAAKNRCLKRSEAKVTAAKESPPYRIVYSRQQDMAGWLLQYCDVQAGPLLPVVHGILTEAQIDAYRTHECYVRLRWILLHPDPFESCANALDYLDRHLRPFGETRMYDDAGTLVEVTKGGAR